MHFLAQKSCLPIISIVDTEAFKEGFPVGLLWLGFPGGSVITNLPANAGDADLIPGLGRFPWRRKWQTTPGFLPGKSHGRRSLAGYSPWDCNRVRHDWVISLSFYMQSTENIWYIVINRYWAMITSMIMINLPLLCLYFFNFLFFIGGIAD